MDDATPDFDAADLADAILGVGPPDTADVAVVTAPSPRPNRALGWVLAFLLFAAVSIVISLAVQLDTDASSPIPAAPCGGLYDECCDDRRGLFDAEDGC